MSKRRLSHQQQRRIQRSQQKHIGNIEIQDRSSKQEERRGLVIANYGKKVLVESEEKQLITCHIKQNLGAIVSGDQVIWLEANSSRQEGLIIAVMPRKSVISRPVFANKTKYIAANIDVMFIVTAPLPALNEGLLDRYLVMAEYSNIMPVIVFNKVDTIHEDELNEIKSRLDIYKQFDYHIVYSSVKSLHGLDELTPFLQNKTSIFVGQSGVGKSSLIKQLLPDVEIKIGDISTATGKGAHTTTAAYLYHLSQGGELIDSPGVREFGLVNIESDTLANYFREFQPHLGHCQFRNCSHVNEKGCAITQALETQQITDKRYQSYLRILDSLQDER
ncbi:MAG: small ribosomal subunit biogenesis GTPase RsgA [Gammaproteobacteria bacterium]|nr:small ribosomal subunit biogenesis GTPase RsgA [Gammaproteobacteria bacterium]